MDVLNLFLSSAAIFLAVWAEWRARRTQTAVRRSVIRSRLHQLGIELTDALHTARDLQESKSRTWPQMRCDSLREALAVLKDAKELTRNERESMELAIVELRTPRENTPMAKTWVRELTDRIIAIRRRVTREMEDMEP